MKLRILSIRHNLALVFFLVFSLAFASTNVSANVPDILIPKPWLPYLERDQQGNYNLVNTNYSIPFIVGFVRHESFQGFQSFNDATDQVPLSRFYPTSNSGRSAVTSFFLGEHPPVRVPHQGSGFPNDRLPDGIYTAYIRSGCSRGIGRYKELANIAADVGQKLIDSVTPWADYFTDDSVVVGDFMHEASCFAYMVQMIRILASALDNTQVVSIASDISQSPQAGLQNAFQQIGLLSTTENSSPWMTPYVVLDALTAPPMGPSPRKMAQLTTGIVLDDTEAWFDEYQLYLKQILQGEATSPPNWGAFAGSFMPGSHALVSGAALSTAYELAEFALKDLFRFNTNVYEQTAFAVLNGQIVSLQEYLDEGLVGMIRVVTQPVADGVAATAFMSEQSVDLSGELDLENLEVEWYYTTPDRPKTQTGRFFDSVSVTYTQPGQYFFLLNIPSLPHLTFPVRYVDVPRLHIPINFGTSWSITGTSGRRAILAAAGISLPRNQMDMVTVDFGDGSDPIIHTREQGIPQVLSFIHEYPESNSTYQATISILSIDGRLAARSLTIETKVGSGGSSTQPPSDYPPRVELRRPARRVDVRQGRRVVFESRGTQAVAGLSMNRWYINGQLVSTQAISGSQSIHNNTFRHRFNTPGFYEVETEYESSTGLTRRASWRVLVEQSTPPEIMSASPGEPDSSGVRGVAVGVARNIQFDLEVSDLENDLEHVLWIVDGEVEKLRRLGSSPASTRWTTSFPSAGIRTVIARVVDRHGNRTDEVWRVAVGGNFDGNHPPECEIRIRGYDDAAVLVRPSVFRVGYSYNVRFHGYDIDGNLAYGEVLLNGRDDWQLHVVESGTGQNTVSYLFGEADSFSLGVMNFPQPGPNVIDLIIRDEEGAECQTQKVVYVLPADELSSQPPTIDWIFPPTNIQYYHQIGQSRTFEVQASMHDPDGDNYRFEAWIGNTYVAGYSVQNEITTGGRLTIRLNDHLTSTGNHQLRVYAVDRAGNRSVPAIFNIRAENHARSTTPVIVRDMPLQNSLMAHPTDRSRFGVSVVSPSGRFEVGNQRGRVRFFGAVSREISLNRAYAAHFVSQNFDLDFGSGVIRAEVIDVDGNRSGTLTWQVGQYNDCGPGTACYDAAPRISNASWESGAHFYFNSWSPRMNVRLDVDHEFGRLDRVETWINGELDRTSSFSLREGFSHTFLNNSLHGFRLLAMRFSSNVYQRGDSGTAEIRIYDREGHSASHFASWTIGPRNHKPQIEGQLIWSLEQDSVIDDRISYLDENGDTVSFVLLEPPLNGELNIDSAGHFQYVPDRLWSGEDHATIQYDDGFGGVGDFEVTFLVSPINYPPEFISDSFEFDVGIATSVNLGDLLRGLYSDAEDSPEELQLRLLVPESNGSARSRVESLDVNTASVEGESVQYDVVAIDSAGLESSAVTVTLRSRDSIFQDEFFSNSQ